MLTLEKEIKDQWLLDKIPEVKDQKEILRRKEFKIFSQTGEDGILHYIFEKIGTINKTFVEIGVEDGRECNTANLSLNFGWRGILIEGNAEYAKKAKEYYKNKPVKVVQSFVSAENINSIIKKNNIGGEIDLLSIDIDGNDYWIWKKISIIDPRVVVIEYNPFLGNEPITISYNKNFERFKGHRSGYYFGASLSALTKLAESKGYILAGCNSFGFNAFFIKKKYAKRKFYNMSPEEAKPPLNEKSKIMGMFAKIKHLAFERV